jgi:hypothetical protein
VGSYWFAKIPTELLLVRCRQFSFEGSWMVFPARRRPAGRSHYSARNAVFAVPSSYEQGVPLR